MARSDVQLMLDVKAGDDASFDFLLQKYRSPLVNFLNRMVRDTATAEDLAQEVFLRVYRARKQYTPSAKFTTWLYRIATNLAVNHARDTRHERPENLASLDEPDQETGATMDVPDANPSAASTISISTSILRSRRLSSAVLTPNTPPAIYDKILSAKISA